MRIGKKIERGISVPLPQGVPEKEPVPLGR